MILKIIYITQNIYSIIETNHHKYYIKKIYVYLQVKVKYVCGNAKLNNY